MDTAKFLQKQLETRLCSEIILNLQLLIVKIEDLKNFSKYLLDNEQEVLSIVDEYIISYSKYFEKSFTEILNMVRLLPDKKVSKNYSFNNMHCRDIDVVLLSLNKFNKFDPDVNKIQTYETNEEKFIEVFNICLNAYYQFSIYFSLRRFDDYVIESIIKDVRNLRKTVLHINEEFEKIRSGGSTLF